jgi:hypothetical protein
VSGTAGQREPPDTTTGELDDELTPLEDCSPDEVLDEEVLDDDVLDDELEVDEPVPDPVAEFEVAAEAVPGIVVALITASTPTPATADIATPVVSRFSVRIAWSRARTLASLAALVSTIRKLRDGP